MLLGRNRTCESFNTLGEGSGDYRVVKYSEDGVVGSMHGCIDIESAWDGPGRKVERRIERGSVTALIPWKECIFHVLLWVCISSVAPLQVV